MKILVVCGDCGYELSVGDKDRSEICNLFKVVCPGCGGNDSGRKEIRWKAQEIVGEEVGGGE